MKATIGLEHIGANIYNDMRALDETFAALGFRVDMTGEYPYRGPAVAEMYRDGAGDLHAHWLAGKRDYTRANSKGSRGIKVWYTLEENRLYWVREPRSWRHVAEYYAAVTPEGGVYYLSEEEANEWLSAL